MTHHRAVAWVGSERSELCGKYLSLVIMRFASAALQRVLIHYANLQVYCTPFGQHNVQVISCL